MRGSCSNLDGQVTFIKPKGYGHMMLSAACVVTPYVFFFQVVNTVLRCFPHILLHGCSGQQQSLGPLLSVLKVIPNKEY